MNCIGPGINLKVLAKALQALSKIGDELYVEATKTQLSLVTLSISKTVCARFHLLNSFFSSYEVNERELAASNSDLLCWKVQLKLLLPLFKGQALEKKIDFFKIEYENGSDFMVFKMKYKCDDIVMVHKLHLMDSETLTIAVAPNSGSNNLAGSGSFYVQLLSMFSNSDNEMTMEIARNKVIARNYTVGAPCRPKMLRSQINLNSREFSHFRVQTETTVNFHLKVLRTAVHFAEAFNMDIEFNFEAGGKPLTMIMRNPTFEVNFVVATLDPNSDRDTDVASTVATNEAHQSQRNVNSHVAPAAHDVTLDDLRALHDENWNDDVENGEKDNINYETKNNNRTNTKSSPKVDESPESPLSKRARTVFARCYDPSFHESMLGEVLAANSDSE